MIKEVLYISTLSSERLIGEIHKKTKRNPGFAVQKFNRLIVKGLTGNGVNTIVISNPPIVSIDGRFWCNLPSEIEGGTEFNYIPFVNKPIVKQLFVFFYTYSYVLKWGRKNRKEKAIICDALTISASLAALLASKLLRIKSVGIVTDIYGLIVGEKFSGLKKVIKELANKIQTWYVRRFSQYVLLTEAMKGVVNPKNHPYIVMEAICDVPQPKHVPLEKYKEPTVLYAGGIEVEYGLKALVDGFRTIKNESFRLIIYGSGTYSEELTLVNKEDSRIVYKGVVPNEEILDAEKKATLLVNPRFSDVDYTKYSFPSKNMEYMASGTPLVTTRLPGIPKDYYPYVFFFEEESSEGYGKRINEILSMPEKTLVDIGQKAKEFVLNNKNCYIQTARIMELLNK